MLKKKIAKTTKNAKIAKTTKNASLSLIKNIDILDSLGKIKTKNPREADLV